jgi:glycerol uptake facilitator-like aquaporin
MGQSLTTDVGVQLLLNMLSAILALGVLIALLAPLSGAHFNPAVTFALTLRRELPWSTAGIYVAAQVFGGVSGVGLAHLMFQKPLLEFSDTQRLTPGTFVGEVVATAGLVFIIVALVHRNRSSFIAFVVPAWIGSAYFFTSSTSFANPAVTLGRIFTDSFAGISAESAGGFVAAQLLGASVALALALALPSQKENQP